MRIEQKDGTVKSYAGVWLKFTPQALMVTSADKVSTVTVSRGSCHDAGGLLACTPQRIVFNHDGKTHQLENQNVTFFVNLGGTAQTLPMSSKTVPPRGVVFGILTAHGTQLTGSGRLDEVTQ